MDHENHTFSREELKLLLDRQLQNTLNLQHGLLHQLYRQIEAFVSICTLLELRRPLPPMRGWSASPDFLVLLLGELMDRQPEVVCELGSGTSTIITGYALQNQKRGKVFSLDHDRAYLDKTARQVHQHGLEDCVELIHAPLTGHEINGARWQWYNLAQAPLPEAIDLLVVDGPPWNIQPRSRYPALPLLIDRLRADAVVLLDDAARPDEKAIVESWLQAFPEFGHEAVDCEKGAAILRRNRP